MSEKRLNRDQARRARRLIWPLLPVLLRTARYLTGREPEAEDLVQETVLKAMRAIDSFEENTNAQAWLMTILRRTHIDRLRHLQRQPDQVSIHAGDGLDLEDPGDPDAGRFDEQWDDPAAMMEVFADEQVIEAIQTLPEEIRWTLLLVDVQGLEHKDAAVILDVPVGTVKSRAHRGRKMLRDHLYELAEDRGWLARRAVR